MTISSLLRNGTLALAGVMACMTVAAQEPAAKAFVDMPDRLMPLLDRSTRLDMIDYFNSGSTTASQNALAGKSRITALTPGRVVVDVTAASSCEIALLPSKGDTLLAVVQTVATPAPDSKLHIYASGWGDELTGRLFTAPELAEWLTAEGKANKAEVDMMVPFMISSGAFDDATGEYVLTNRLKEFLTDDVYSPMAGYFKPEIRYKWTGSKLARQN